ncbi:Ubiquitin-associated and SH3 domain-containing protein B [Triplophysa tibetana]|uniref:Ubiquitin-associated and SH3 domain-containing protein B n=1 Tax=Triplophysa tibetana TaxID=1572043 RepID=A0A5A9MYY2_9TELE|nr:Ubiquitin-associated and SH3 domain-containing protein B [Triplophysa tibetana]
MAAKEDLYSKIIPRRLRRSGCVSVKHGSHLDVLLSMGFPQHRALFSHLDDPYLDDPLPREYVLYLCPSGPLQNQLSHFWQQSRLTCGKNKAHNIFPHITLCLFFMCPDNKVVAVCEALQSTVNQWRGRFPSPLPLELYTSTNFIGLFVEEQVAETLKKFASDFAVEAATKADVHVEPHKKQLHLTLAYHFPTNHFSSLEKLAKGIEVKLGCDWLAAIFSRDIRFANHESLRVMYPYTPQNDDELELVLGDFIFSSTVEQMSTSEGWVYGTSLCTGLSGLLPENYVSPADECDTWVFHGSHSFFSTTPSEMGYKESKSLDCLISLRCLDNSRLRDSAILSVICQPMQVPNSKQLEYVRSNLNMPAVLPAWGEAHIMNEMDAPITVVGSTQARIVGEAMQESNTTIDFVYCSPSLRCVQTAHDILRGMQQDGRISIRVEPGLFEWTKWVSGTSLPPWIPPTDLAAAKLNVDTTYRPLFPINKLTMSETYDMYISRSYKVTRDILAYCENKGNNILFVAHASSLEACTRQIQGLSPQNHKDFVQVVRKIPYLGLCACEEQGDTGTWQLVDPPILPLTHGPNHSFSWRETLQQE